MPGAGRLLHALGAGRDLRRLRLAWIGDGNNVCHSLILLASLLGTEMVVAAPPEFEPAPRVLETARAWGGRIAVTTDVREAATRGGRDLHRHVDQHGAGGRARAEPRGLRALPGQRARRGLRAAGRGRDALPARPSREEITDAVLDGPQSVVLDQSENRLHVQKAVLLRLLGKG